MALWSMNRAPDPTPEQAYVPLAKMLSELRKYAEAHPRRSKQISDFDSACQSVLNKFGAIRPDKIDTAVPYIRFPFPPDATIDFSGMADTVGRSFAQRETAVLWQKRQYQDMILRSFDCATLGPDIARFGNSTSVTLWPYRDPRFAEFATFNFEWNDRIDSICGTSICSFLLSKTTVIVVPMNRRTPPRFVTLSATGPGTLTDFSGGAIVGFPSLSVLYVVGHNAEVTSTSLFFKGVSALIALAGKVICAVPGSGVLRVLDENGRDERILVGHCGAIDSIHKLSGTRFATSGQDNSIHIWDIGEMCPIAVVLLPGVGITSLAGSDDFLVCGFKNKRIGVVDLIRRKPFFGIETQNIVPAKLAFDEPDDTLYMFGAFENEIHGPPRMMFADNERQFEQKVFRKYQRFTGVAGDPRRGQLSPPSLFCARKPRKKHM
jgi:hypothetical protein